MVIDKLENIETYKGLSNDIYSGLNFIKTANKNIAVGVYLINEKVKAIVSEYDTIDNFTRGFEAHMHVIDIQYPIIGIERIKWSPINEMEINIPYDIEHDRTFYKNPHRQGTNIDIGNGFFAIMFPNDGHSPKHYVTKPEFIKKITVKVSLRLVDF
jgi:biofilm protein TabA